MCTVEAQRDAVRCHVVALVLAAEGEPVVDLLELDEIQARLLKQYAHAGMPPFSLLRRMRITTLPAEEEKDEKPPVLSTSRLQKNVLHEQNSLDSSSRGAMPKLKMSAATRLRLRGYCFTKALENNKII